MRRYQCGVVASQRFQAYQLLGDWPFMPSGKVSFRMTTMSGSYLGQADLAAGRKRKRTAGRMRQHFVKARQVQRYRGSGIPCVSHGVPHHLVVQSCKGPVVVQYVCLTVRLASAGFQGSYCMVLQVCDHRGGGWF